MVTASVIIVAKNEEKTLPFLLRRLERQTFQDFEIIFIDNMSMDKTPEIVENFANSTQIPLYFERREGVIGALNNYALTIARGKYILFVDGDEIPVNNWIQEHIDCLNIGYDSCIGPVIFVSNDKSNVAKLYFNKSILEIIYNKRSMSKRVTFNMGNSSFRADIIRTIKFHPYLGISYDGESGYRFIKHGYKLGFAEGAIVFHPAPNDFRKHLSYWWKLAYAQKVLFSLHSYSDLAKIIFKNNILSHLDPREMVKSTLWKTEDIFPVMFLEITAFIMLIGTYIRNLFRNKEKLLYNNIQRIK